MKDLPERDTTKPTEQQGMFRKFEVRRIDGSDRPSGKHHGCRYFVLDLDHDQHAAAAMAAYAQAARETHPTLSAELAAQYPPSSPTWLNHDAAISDPIFHEARGIMGTENYGQEEALRMAILHVISAYSGSLERGHAQPPKGRD